MEPAADRLGRLAGGLVTVGAVLTALGYVLVPVDGAVGSGSRTLLQVAPTFGDVGALAHAALVAAVGVAAVAGAGRHLALVAAAPLPWVVSLAATVVVPGLAEDGLLDVVLGGGAVLQALGVLLAVGAAVRGLRLRAPLGDLAALVVALGGLWLSVGVHWYRIADGAFSLRQGSLLEGDPGPVRLTWVATGLASVALLLAVLQRGTARRAAGAGAAAVLVLEAVRRAVLFPDELLSGGGGGIPVFRAEVLLPLLVVPLLGAAGAAYLATTDLDAAPDLDPVPTSA